MNNMRLIIGLENHEDLRFDNPDEMFLDTVFNWYTESCDMKKTDKDKSVFYGQDIMNPKIRMVLPFSKICYMYIERDAPYV